MSIDSILAMKTDPRLLESIQRAAVRPLSSEEMLAQRVSFVFGSVGKDNGATRERVRDVILNLTSGTRS